MGRRQRRRRREAGLHKHAWETAAAFELRRAMRDSVEEMAEQGRRKKKLTTQEHD